MGSNRIKIHMAVSVPVIGMQAVVGWIIFTNMVQPGLWELSTTLPKEKHSFDAVLILGVMMSYVSIGQIVGFVSRTFKPLKSWREHGLIFYLALGFGIGTVLSICFGMVIGPNLGILVGLLIGLIFGVISGLREEWWDAVPENY
jgi:amino acid transporter